jgi:hypothetical protein
MLNENNFSGHGKGTNNDYEKKSSIAMSHMF